MGHYSPQTLSGSSKPGQLVQPLTMVDNSAFFPTHLTIPPSPAYPSYPELCMLCISSGEDPMTFPVFFFLLFLLLLSLAWLGRLSLHHHGLPCSRAGAVHPVIHRLLKPRSPDDCPACRLASPPASSAGPAPAPARPWCEVKSRRGAPKRVKTEGYACPNRKCPYFGITDAHIHALVGDGTHGQAERIQTFRCQACHTTFTRATRHALVPPKNPLAARRHGTLGASRRAGPFGG